MKRYLLVAALLLLCATAFTQEKYKVARVSYGKWHNILKKWDWTPASKSDLIMTFYDDGIGIDNNNKTRVVFTEEEEMVEEDTYYVYKWKGVDEKRKNVRVLMTVAKDSEDRSVTITYNNSRDAYMFILEIK